MENIKKNQHYVWKHYLCAWAIKDKVAFAYLKKTNKVVQDDLKSFAQKKFFNASEEFTQKEQRELLEITYQLSDKNTLEACLAILSAFITYSEIKSNLSSTNIKFNDKDLALLKANKIENIHSKFEAYGRKLIEVKTLEDLAFLKNKKELLHTMIYLCIQYTRTKSMRNNLYKSSLPNKFSNPISIIFAINLANTLTFDENLCFTILNNQSNVKFITADQPVINLAEKGKDGSVNDFMFYYPLNPKTAIQLNIEGNKSIFQSKEIGESKVNEFNTKIYQSADNFIFCNSEKQILEYQL